MSKKKTNNQVQVAAKNPQVEELLKNGKVIVSAKSHDELLAKVAEIIAECKAGEVGAGAVGQNFETGGFEQRLDVVNKK